MDMTGEDLLGRICRAGVGTCAGIYAHRGSIARLFFYRRDGCLYFTYIPTQSRNVLYQNWLFSGFKTQWPSSGNTTSLEGTPCRWSVLKNSRDCVYGTRKSCSPATTSVGVLYFPSAPA